MSENKPPSSESSRRIWVERIQKGSCSEIEFPRAKHRDNIYEEIPDQYCAIRCWRGSPTDET